MYETLVSFNPGEAGKLVPTLAESWDVADNGDTWKLTFKLNPNAKFASGNPVTADDFVFSWGRAIDINKSPAFLLIDVCGITKENVTAVDATTLEVKLPKTVSPQVCLAVLTFSTAAACREGCRRAEHGLRHGRNLAQRPLRRLRPLRPQRLGPQRQRDARRQCQLLGRHPPAIKRVIIQNTPELANLQAAIETGDADIAQDLGSDQVAALEGNPDLTLDQGAV